MDFLESFDSADDGTMQVVNGNCADADRDFMSGLVAQSADGLRGLRGLDGAGDRGIFAAEFTVWLIAMPQDFRDSGFRAEGETNDLMTQTPADALRPIAPQHNLPLQVDHAHA
jgi:hypothetical protein